MSLDAPEADTLQKLESDPYFSGDKAQMALQKALLTLPEKQRMVFNLKYYQDEIRADVRYFRYFGGGFESVLPPCRKKIREDMVEED